MKQHVIPFKLFEQEGYPMGAKDDPNAPYNQGDSQYTEPEVPENGEFETIYFDGEHALLQNKSGEVYIYHIDTAERKDYKEFARIEKFATGKDEDGEVEYEYDDDWELDGNIIENYVNAHLDTLSRGAGIEAWESGEDLVKVDMNIVDDLSELVTKQIRDAEEYERTKKKPTDAKGQELSWWRAPSKYEIKRLKHQLENLGKIKSILK